MAIKDFKGFKTTNDTYNCCDTPVRESIAQVLSSAVAPTGGLAVGDEFYLSDGNLYTATSAISQGSAIVVYPTSGYNCKLSDSVTRQIASGVESAYQLNKDTSGWSGKNRLPMTISELKRLNTAETWSDNVYVRYNITFSVTTDDDGNVTEIDAHGTATRAVYFTVGNMNIGSSAMDSVDNPKANGYILSAHDSVHLKYSTSSHNFVFDIPNGTQLNHAKLYPMLRRDNVIDATFEPYHKTVDEQKADNSVIGNVETASASTHAYSSGQGFICDGQFRVAKGSGIAVSEQITDSNSDVKPIADLLTVKNVTSEITSSSNINVSEVLENISGHLLTYQISLTTTAEISEHSNIITSGIKRAFSHYAGIAEGLFMDTDYNQYRLVYWSASGSQLIRNLDTIPNGKTIRGTISYII